MSGDRSAYHHSTRVFIAHFPEDNDVRVHSQCCIPITESPKHKEELAYWEKLLGSLEGVKARGPGCQQCDNQGITGRTVVAEIVLVDDIGREYIKKGDVHGWEKYLIEQGWKTFHDQPCGVVDLLGVPAGLDLQ